MNERKPCWGLLCRRSVLAPTLKGWCVLLLVGLVLLSTFLVSVHPFLAVNRQVPADLLVVEGWAPDYALEVAIAEFKSKPYKKLLVTGVPLEKGVPLSEYKNYAELGAACLLKMGLDPAVVQAVPAPKVQRDRTYTSALALKHWLKTNQVAATNLNVISGGAHCRRTRLLFEKALGKEVAVGIVSVEDDAYDPKRWWKYSAGVRAVIGELLAYGYARFLFWPTAAD